MEKKKTDCSALPPGWKKEEVIRKSGLSAGKSDIYYYSPSGRKFRSKPQLVRFLGSSVDLSSFDFRTGNVTVGKVLKHKQKRHEGGGANKSGKLDLNTALPIRQTAPIFKQPVTMVTSHHGNKVKSDQQRAPEPPRQMFWEQRLKGLRSSDVSEEPVRSMRLPPELSCIGPAPSEDCLLWSISSALHLSSGPISGQHSNAERNPALWINCSQPRCRGFTITDQQIREQEEVVEEVRRSLVDALSADSIARITERRERRR